MKVELYVLVDNGGRILYTGGNEKWLKAIQEERFPESFIVKLEGDTNDKSKYTEYSPTQSQ